MQFLTETAYLFNKKVRRKKKFLIGVKEYWHIDANVHSSCRFVFPQT